MKPLTYDHGPVSIEVRPSASGVATIYDKEIVLYIASLMAAKLEAGEEVAQDFVFTADDLFSVTGSNHSARSYGRLSEALERLQGTQIKTNIEAGGEGEEGFFSWLSEARLHYTKTKTGERRLKAVKVRLCDWLYRAILRDRQVLDYAASYFQLGPIERRIYEVARATSAEDAGETTPLEVDLATFGCRSAIRTRSPISHCAQTDRRHRDDPRLRSGARQDRRRHERPRAAARAPGSAGACRHHPPAPCIARRTGGRIDRSFGPVDGRRTDWRIGKRIRQARYRDTRRRRELIATRKHELSRHFLLESTNGTGFLASKSAIIVISYSKARTENTSGVVTLLQKRSRGQSGQA